MSVTNLPISTRVRRLYVGLVALLIFCATMLSFVNGVGGGFVNWDDDRYVTANPLVRQLSAANLKAMFGEPQYYSYIPLTLFSHTIDVELWGMNPKGHHFTNVLLHAANAAFLFLVMILMLNSIRLRQESRHPFLLRVTAAVIVASTAGALLFALHPQRIESVAWVSGRKDLLCAFFLLPSFGAYILWRRKSSFRWLVLSIILFGLALLAKPAAMPFPLVLLLVDVFLIASTRAGQMRLKNLMTDKIPFFILSLAAAIIAQQVAPPGAVNPVGELSLLERLIFPFYMFVFYILKLIAPVNLSPVYPDFSAGLLFASPFLVAGVLGVAFILLRRGYPGLLVAVLSYVLMILPTFLGVSSGLQPLADRYSYLSTVSIFVMFAGLMESVWRRSAQTPAKNPRRLWLAVIVFVLIAVSSYRTTRHIEVWQSSTALWDQALRYAPATMEEFEERKPYLKPDFLDVLVNAGTARYAEGDTTGAVHMFRRAVALDSCAADAQYNLGVLSYERGDAVGAIEHFKRTTTCDPLYAKAYHNLGVVHLAMGNTAAALDAFRNAARLGFEDSRSLLEKNNVPW